MFVSKNTIENVKKGIVREGSLIFRGKEVYFSAVKTGEYIWKMRENIKPEYILDVLESTKGTVILTNTTVVQIYSKFKLHLEEPLKEVLKGVISKILLSPNPERELEKKLNGCYDFQFRMIATPITTFSFLKLEETTTSQFQKKMDFYVSQKQCEEDEKVVINTNPKYKHFDQTYFTAGDPEQFQLYRNKTVLNKVIPNIPPNRFAPENITIPKWDKYNYDDDAIMNTFNYLFHKFKKSIFVQILDGAVSVFLPFSKNNYTNEWSDKIQIDPNYKTMLDFFAVVEGERFRPRNLNKNVATWEANNGLLKYRFPIDEGGSNAPNVANMFKTLCRERKIPDIEFFVNRRDFPLIKSNDTEPYNNIYDGDVPLLSHKYDKYAPILSMVGGEHFADIPIPTGEDWTRVSWEQGHLFSQTCDSKYEIPPLLPWNKRKPIAVFRGTSTGVGTTIDNNIRLKLALLSHTSGINKFGVRILDAGITKWNNRPRKYEGDKYLQIIDIKSLPFSLVPFMSPAEQATHKYVVNVDGHVSAYRLSLELQLGFCVLLADSKYHMWFRKMLKPYVHYVPVKADLSDLIEQINWCRNNDKKCEEISNNAIAFAKTYLTREGILDYLQLLLIELKKMTSFEMCINRDNLYGDSIDENKDLVVFVNAEAKGVAGKGYCLDTNELNRLNQSTIAGIKTIKHPYTSQLLDNSIIDAFEAGWNTILIDKKYVKRQGTIAHGRDYTFYGGKPIHRKTFLTGNIDKMRNEIVKDKEKEDTNIYTHVIVPPEEYKMSDNDRQVLEELQAQNRAQNEELFRRQEQAGGINESDVELTDNNVEQLFASFPDDTTDISIEDTEITWLPNLNRFSVLNVLKCTGNIYLQFLPPLIDSIIELDIRTNNLTTLPALPKRLKRLHCEQNRLTTLPELPKTLKFLTCDENRLTALPALPKNLELLSCQINYISIMPALPVKLFSLYCGRNRLTVLPSLPNKLQNLYCDDNPRINVLPRLPNSLIQLSCAKLNLTELPTLPNNLLRLDCSQNKLKILPPSRSLMFLNCAYNQLTRITNLPNTLINLTCNHNNITTLSPIPQRLNILLCSHNRLESLPPLPLSLNVLNCSFNNLTVIPNPPHQRMSQYIIDHQRPPGVAPGAYNFPN